MALVDTTWYCNAGDQSTTGHYAVAKRVSGATVVAGQLVRQFTAPAVNSERVFVCIVAGTVAVATDATWVLTRGAKTVDGTATWMECTGQAALNGDLTNTTTWASVKAATPAVLGQIIKRNNNASYQICTTAGAMSATEPTFSDTAGVTTTDTTAVWTSLGPVGNFTGGMAPHARLANACASTWFAIGNTIYVGDNHAELQATSTLTISPATSFTTTGRILCHNRSGSYPPTSSDLMTTATVSTTVSIPLTISLSNGALYIYGLTFLAGSSNGTSTLSLTTSSAWLYLDNCSLRLMSTWSTNSIVVGGTGVQSVITFNRTTVYFSATTQTVYTQNAQLLWQNTGAVLVAGSVVPASFIMTPSSGYSHTVALEALDLSQLTGNLFSPNANTVYGSILIKDCKLSASAAVVTPINYGEMIQLVRSSA